MVKNDWDEGFEDWKAKKSHKQVNNRANFINNIEKEAIRDVKEVEKFVKKEERLHPVLFHVLHILAWVIPIAIILFVFYVNYLPFGYHAEYTVQVMEDGSVKSSSSAIYFEDLKGKKITNLSDVYSLGAFNAVIRPKVVMKNALVNASILGEDVYFTKLDSNISWDYSWDFSKNISSWNGASLVDSEGACSYFNGSLNQTLNYPNSSEMFEDDSFIVYVKWKPEDSSGRNQQLLGHYNWEIWQDNSSVKFMIGRLEDSNGSMPAISLPINASFFNISHELLAIYRKDKQAGKGYTALFVDGKFVGKKNFMNQSIWAGYNSRRDLSIGWSPHNYGNNSYFTGCIYEASFDFNEASYLVQDSFKAEGNIVKIPIVGNGKLTSIKVDVAK